MPSWMIDTQDKTAQQVLPSYEPMADQTDVRFRFVSAQSLQLAIEQAQFESVALKKIQRVIQGGSALMSDRELDWLTLLELLPTNVAQAINPDGLGILDRYLVGRRDHPEILRMALDAKTQGGQ